MLDCGVEHKCGKGCGETFESRRKKARHEGDCNYHPRFYWCPLCPYVGYHHLKHYDDHAKQHDPVLPPSDTMLRDVST